MTARLVSKTAKLEAEKEISLKKRINKI